MKADQLTAKPPQQTQATTAERGRVPAKAAYVAPAIAWEQQFVALTNGSGGSLLDTCGPGTCGTPQCPYC